MCRFIILTFVSFAALVYSVKSEINVISSVEPYILEDLINSTIEGLRQNISDPFKADFLNIDLPDEEDALIAGNGTLTNLDVEGLHGFEVSALNFALIGARLNVTVVFPVLHFFTDFDIDLLAIAHILGIYGVGNVTVHLENVVLEGSAQANLTGGIQVENLLLQLSLGTAYFEIHNLQDNEGFSQYLTDLLNDSAVSMIDDNQELVTSVISPIAQTLINSVLANVNFTDILSLDETLRLK